MQKLKENLKQELYEFEEKVERNPKAKMSFQELQRVNLASDTVKNLCKIEMLEEEGYSEASDWMGDGRIYGTSYEGGSSYARGGRGRGRNARRDSMGRYSREGGSYENGGSYARENRGGNSSYARGGRDGYSRDDAKEQMVEKMEEMIEMLENS